MAKIVVQPGAEIEVDPPEIQQSLQMFEQVVPDRHALLIMGDLGDLVVEDVRDEAGLPLTGDEVAFARRRDEEPVTSTASPRYQNDRKEDTRGKTPLRQYWIPGILATRAKWPLLDGQRIDESISNRHHNSVKL